MCAYDYTCDSAFGISQCNGSANAATGSGDEHHFGGLGEVRFGRVNRGVDVIV